jgi:exopolysaccharide biosynthesis WecB/TagA/CpsF family protein
LKTIKTTPTPIVNSRAKLSLFGVEIDNVTMEDAVQLLDVAISQNGLTQVAFMNAHCFNIWHTDLDYQQTIDACDFVFGDGSGVKMGAKLAGQAIKDNVNGTDLYPLLCNLAAERGWRIFYFGATEDSNQRVVDNARRRFPNLKIAGQRHGYFTPANTDAIVEQICQSKSDILLVALGVPLQDVWIHQNKANLSSQISLAMGVGGLFDYADKQDEGNGIPRAPLWMGRLGIEWIFRLIQEPKRMWKRYILGNPLFLWRGFWWGRQYKKRSR